MQEIRSRGYPFRWMAVTHGLVMALPYILLASLRFGCWPWELEQEITVTTTQKGGYDG